MKSLGTNYIPGSISFAEGFAGPKGDVGFRMEFSMEKAKQIAKELGENNIKEIDAGLDGDWRENSCTIFDGTWKEYTAYKGSIWATPIIIVKFKDKPAETFECFDNKPKLKCSFMNMAAISR